MLAKLRSGICKKIRNKPVLTKIEPVSKLRTNIGMKRLGKPVLILGKLFNSTKSGSIQKRFEMLALS